jgi:hypothetical protein
MIRFFRREKAIFLLVWVVVFCGAADIAFGRRGGQPSAFTHSVLPFEFVEQVVTEEIDLEAVRAEDEQREAEGEPYRFAIGHQVSITPDTAGTWEELDGEILWRLQVTSPGALTLNLGFSRYRMPAGGRLFIYTVDHNEVLGAYSEQDNEEHGQLWTPVIHSDDIVVEVTVPSSAVDELELELIAINEGYRGFRPIDKGLGESGLCNVNVACSQGDGWRDQIRSVALLTVRGVAQCSGVLVNNTAKDSRPYFLTANHCGINTGNASTIVVYWKYEASTCGGTTAPTSYNQTGSILRANYSASDFSLVELDDMPLEEFGVYYAGWDWAVAAPSSGVSIHHPSGDMKKISFENNPLSITSYGGSASPGDGTHLRVADWDVGTTEGGSSGCPIFNPNKRIVGQLHGGYAACGNNLADWYGRFYVSWTGGGTASSRLSDWLDPLGLGVTYLDGNDPFRPPKAEDVNVLISFESSATIVLAGSDDGLPDPPGALSYIIMSLPGGGELSDAGGGVIGSIPYTLVSYGSVVVYTPGSGFSGADGFTYKVNDGGTAPGGGDSAVASVSTLVVAPIYTAYMDSEPGWSAEGEWQWGVPTGQGGTSYGNPDPNSGYTGSKVYGINLSGDYSTAVGGSYYITTQVIDCSGYSDVHLRFARWLNCDRQSRVYATVEVCNDGGWTEPVVWENSGPSAVTDGSWQLVDYDINSVADNNSTVYVRWGHRVASGSARAYSGWNIDDVKIVGLRQCDAVGDFDADCGVDFVDFGILGGQWQGPAGSPSADIAPEVRDGFVDILDLAVFAGHWLEGL